jgi:hypothetical protein
VVNALEVTAAVVGVFFAVGIIVGILLVMAVSGAGRPRLGGGQQFPPGSADQHGLNPPESPAPAQPQEPDDRDYPWWPSPR